jgi:hypothetical protein
LAQAKYYYICCYQTLWLIAQNIKFYNIWPKKLTKIATNFLFLAESIRIGSDRTQQSFEAKFFSENEFEIFRLSHIIFTPNLINLFFYITYRILLSIMHIQV